MLLKRIYLMIYIAFVILLSSFTSFTSIPAFADYSQCQGCHLYGGKFDGYTTAPIELGYWSDPSISQYGYSDSVSHAVSEWGPQPYLPSLNNTSETASQIRYFMGDLDPGTGGQVFFYNSLDQEISDQVEFSDIEYEYVNVVIDDVELKKHSSFGQSLRNAVVTHETGHALGVSHLDNSPAHSGDHVMKSSTLLNTLTTTDIQHAQYKFLNDY